MTEDELDQLLADLEDNVATEVRAVLAEVADEFARSLQQATEIVAARFSVSSIARAWRQRVPRLVRRLLRVAETAAHTAADDVDATLPDGWDGLPQRYDVHTLPPQLGSYVGQTEALLNAIGGRLATAANRELAEGLNAGETTDQLRARMRAAFNRESAQLGDAREERIARTEAQRAWNMSTLAAARALTGPDRPLVKQWRIHNSPVGDSRVRHSHDAVDGQVRLLDEAFTVGGFPMQAPGDPAAPAEQTINCRCKLRLSPAKQTASATSQGLQSQMPPRLKEYWLAGPGAAKIRWGTPGDFDRCVRAIRGKFPQDPEGLCANLHHEATGRWPGQHSNENSATTPPEETPVDAVTAAADSEHTGAMIALMPIAEDAERLAIQGGETADQLHTTLFYLGEAANWTPQQQATLTNAIREHATTGLVAARAFGAAHWNPHGDEPVWVWNIGDNPDDRNPYALNLEDTRIAVANALMLTEGLPEVPDQYTPWAPHMAAVYDTSRMRAGDLVDGCGPITFDRIRVAFAGDYTDIPLDRTLEAAAVDDDEMMPDEEWQPPTRAWSTPDTTALAYENQETGDGRIFAPGALSWSNGPWPLQYAEEMLSGHDGAQLAGAIQTMDRDGDRITGAGVLYCATHAGYEAEWLLDQQAPLGVSVDLDDVDVEFLDRTEGDSGEESEPLVASLASASVLRLDDGSWIIRGHTAGEWTASGIGLARNARTVEWITAPGGALVAAAAVRDAFPHLTAAAGDPDSPEQGTLVHSEAAGDMLMRIRRARVRGATLVSVPAFADARIVLSPPVEQQDLADEPYALAAAATSARARVITYVSSSVIPVTARDIAEHFGDMDIAAIRRHLSAGVESGRLVRIARGLYVAATDLNRDLAAAVTGETDLPVAGRDVEWDGPGAQQRVFEWATGEDGTVDTGKVGMAFLWVDPDGDPQTQAAWKLGYADVTDGELRIVPQGVFAVASVLQGGRGGADIPAEDQDAIRDKVATLYEKIADALDDPGLTPPWGEGDDMSDLEASAWRAMRELPPMPAGWFTDPVAEGLLTGTSPGVNYKDGRVYGWVAKKGVPHAGYPGKNLTIEKLMRDGMDFSNFLRQRFTLDDGSEVRVGPMTADVGHHRDGAQCETAACQFDNSGTTAGIVTVGYSEGNGLWFSGASAPWLSDWDRSVFMSCSPSYHLSKARKGWDFRAVLSVPVPGHPTPLVAAIASVVERSNLAITAAAALIEPEPVVEPEPQHDRAEGATPAVEVLTAALLNPAFLDRFTDALTARQAEREREQSELASLFNEVASIKDEITASATPTEGE